MIKTPVVVKTEDGFEYRKRASMRARCTFRLERRISMQKVLWE